MECHARLQQEGTLRLWAREGRVPCSAAEQATPLLELYSHNRILLLDRPLHKGCASAGRLHLLPQLRQGCSDLWQAQQACR